MGFLDAWDGVDLLVLTITTTVASTYAAGDISYYPTTLTTSIQPFSTTPSTANTTDGSSTSGLPIQSKIALGIGLGIGFPSLMISAILFCIKLREIRRENRERKEGRAMDVGRGGVGMGVSVNHISEQKPE